MRVGDKIKKRRIELGLSQDELAIAVGYKSRSSINKIELNSRDFPRKVAYAFANALRVPVEYLLVDLDDPTDDEFIASLGNIKKEEELDDELSAINILLHDLGEKFTKVDDNVSLGECGILSDDEIEFIKNSVKSSANNVVELIRQKKMRELRDHLSGRK